jgi:tripartite-type tricarboxylate transporter receptor subunit TctC
MREFDSMLDRRKAVKVIGAGSVTALAGCSSSGGSSASESDSGSSESDTSSDDSSTGGSDYPSQEVELVIPYGTAGGYNAYTRLVGEYLPEYLGAPEIVYNNVVGAGGRVATNQVYQDDPDGYTMMLMNGDNTALQEVLYDLDFEPLEMTYLPQVTEETAPFGISPELDINTWDDFVNATVNDELKFGSESPTSSGVIAPVLAGANAGAYEPDAVIDNFVQYPTKNEMIAGIQRGNINVMASSYSSVLPFVESGDLDPFLVTSSDPEPPENTPDAVTLESEGVESAEQTESAVASIRVFAGPPGIPEDRTQMISDAFMSAFEDEDLQAEAEEINRPIRPTTGSEAKRKVSQKIDSFENISGLLSELSSE